MEALPLQSATLLIVDDDSLITELFSQYMMRQGFRVLAALSGEEALATVANEGDALRLIVTDMTMPGMDGMTLAKALHALNPCLPVILATGHDMTESPHILPPNVVAVVRKPYRNKILAGQIRQFLEHPDQPFPDAT